MDVREIILDEIKRVAREQKKTLASLNDDLPIFQSGLDSLCFAVLVTNLDTRLGVDPFNMLDDGSALPETIGDLIRFYEQYIRTAASHLHDP